MADVVDPVTRSRMMSGIRGKNTKPELWLRKALHALGFRFRVHVRDLPGRPDIVLPKWKAVVLVHGCFWHQHGGCRFATRPATRPDFWQAKFASNIERDRRQLAALQQIGWRTAVIWECSLRHPQDLDATAAALADWLTSGAAQLETEPS